MVSCVPDQFVNKGVLGEHHWVQSFCTREQNSATARLALGGYDLSAAQFQGPIYYTNLSHIRPELKARLLTTCWKAIRYKMPHSYCINNNQAFRMICTVSYQNKLNQYWGSCNLISYKLVIRLIKQANLLKKQLAYYMLLTKGR